jgi:hypothetical protein
MMQKSMLIVPHIWGFLLKLSSKFVRASLIVLSLPHGLLTALSVHFYQPYLAMSDLKYESPQTKFRPLSKM